MLICPNSGLGNQIGNYVLGRFLEEELCENVQWLFSASAEIDRPFMLDKFNTILNPASKEEILSFLNTPANNLLYANLAKNLLFKRRRYFNSFYKVINRIQIEYDIAPAKSLKFMAKVMLFNNTVFNPVIKNCFENAAIADCYSPIPLFEKIRPQMQKEFELKIPFDEQNKLLARKIEDCQNAIGVHIRRGDYKTYGIKCAKASYYTDKAQILCKKYPDAKIFVFSDEYPYAKKVFESFDNATFADFNSENEGYYDFSHLTKCKHKILSASSFSMWAKYLSYNNGEESIPSEKDLERP